VQYWSLNFRRCKVTKWELNLSVRGPCIRRTVTSGVFSISSLVRISMTSFPTLTCSLSKNTHVHIITRKLHGGLKIWISFSRGKKQYSTHSLPSFAKYCFYHSKIKSISSRRRLISSIWIWKIAQLNEENELTQ